VTIAAPHDPIMTDTSAARSEATCAPVDTGLRLCILASGSRGNAIHVSDGTTAILFDAGMSGAALQRRMARRLLRPEAIDAIVVSHEHNDHIQGVGVMARRFGATVYVSRPTHEAARKALGKIDRITHFSCGSPFEVGRMRIHPFSTSHDASDPAGFTISSNGCKIGIATDLGVVTELVRTHLARCNALVLEANHDPQLLEGGPYPWPLKQRIRSRNGHLSNEDTGNLLATLIHPGLQHVILAHLSAENNTPERALSTVSAAIGMRPLNLSVARQDTCTRVFRVGGKAL
jgi:phosphoribosyl 1,2-cyclic phosphodiesterase